jgi:energy-coupling factor transporter ATP-binding protein EcfA2
LLFPAGALVGKGNLAAPMAARSFPGAEDDCGILWGNMAEPSESERRAVQNAGLPAGYVRHFRIFLASPGDVAAERKIAREVITQLQYEPQFRRKVFLEHVAWDDPGGGTVMRATINPQEAIERGLGEPAQCDIVVVILWARMGTPLPVPPYHKTNGEPYYSGTEWEYENAMEGSRRNQRPEVLVYRRTEDPLFSPRDPGFESKVEQWKLVEKFFAQFSDPKTGAIRRGCNFYESPDDFRQHFTQHLRGLVEELLQAPAPPPTVDSAASLTLAPPKLWPGSPFPGLRAFTDQNAPIFFGRGRETDNLVERINRDRFVAVVGASGSGKSSLVWAGLIPALKGNSIRSEHAASSDWLWLRMTPGGAGDDPFVALAFELRPYLRREARDIAREVAAKPEVLTQLIPQILAGRPDWAELLLFIDQFEELVTVVADRYRAPFVEMLSQAMAAGRFRAVATLRADFYHQMIPVSPALVELLQNGSYPLGVPDPLSLREMIVRPAERAGLQFERGLAERIVRDTGTEPGGLALMAYLLDELYSDPHRGADGRLSSRAYDDLGKVEGAIGKRAEQAFNALSAEAQRALPQVFRRLVKVDGSGTATRRRAPQAELERFARDAARELVREFTKARLLVADTEGANPTVEVAHEALLRKWDRLAT